MTIVTARPGVFLFIDMDEPVRVWTGSSSYTLAPDAVDTEGGEYLGLGFTEVPSLDRLLNGEAGEYTLSLAGVDPDLLGLIDAPEDFSGAPVHIGEIKFDAAWRPLGGVNWVGRFDAETVGFALRQAGDSHTAEVSMTIGTASTGRRLAAQRHWSPVEQRIASPTDRFFDYVPKYSRGSKRKYPA